MGIQLENGQEKGSVSSLFLQAVVFFYLLSTIIQNLMILVTSDKISFEGSNAMSLCLCGVMGSFKFVAVIRHRKLLSEIKTKLIKLVNELDQEKIAEIALELRFFQRLARGLFLSSMFVSSIFGFSPGIALIYSLIKTGTPNLVLPYSMWYPFNVDSFLFLAYFHEAMCGFVWTAVPQAIDGLIILMTAQLATLFEAFGAKLCSDINDATAEISKRAVEYHNELLNISNSLVHIFSVSLLVNVMGQTGLICFTAFTITVGGRNN